MQLPSTPRTNPASCDGPRVFIGRRIRAHVETRREPFGVVQAALLGLVGDIADTSESQEVIVGLSGESKEQVDDLTDKAVAAGAQSLGDADDQGFMYMRGIRDLDGHQWSFIRMDMSAVPED